MIPLLLCPHDWQVLDANTLMYSTRYATQKSCMGLYVRYERIRMGGGGAWFVAKTVEGKVVGLSTARGDDTGNCQIDAFAHARFSEAWEELVQAAIGRSREHGMGRCYAVVSVRMRKNSPGSSRWVFAGLDREKSSISMEGSWLRSGWR